MILARASGDNASISAIATELPCFDDGLVVWLYANVETQAWPQESDLQRQYKRDTFSDIRSDLDITPRLPHWLQ